MTGTTDFEAWATSAASPLFRQALMLISDQQLAEDLVQDTLTTMFVHWRRIDTTAQPTAYAKKTLYRHFISKWRRSSSGEIVTNTFPETLTVEIDPDTRIDIKRALQGLRPIERALIIARYAEGLPVAETAALLGRSEAWVKTTASRVLDKLRHSPDLLPTSSTSGRTKS